PPPPAPKPVAPPDITDLIGALDPKAAPIGHEPLFNPDAPFTAHAHAQAHAHAHAAAEPARSAWRRIAILVAVLVVIGTAAIVAPRMLRKAAQTAPLGTLAVQTNPPGAQIFVDGVEKGLTPARVSLSAGAHILELRGRGVPRVIPVTVAAGAEVSQYLELPQTPATGSLLVQSEPAGPKVSRH